MSAVTVVCPAYNRSHRIRPTIHSVRAQTFEDWELLVMSDGSEDDTDTVVQQEAARDPRIRLHRLEHSGHPSGPRNYALELSRSPVVAYIDHDDVWRPDHLEVLTRLLVPGVDVAVTGYLAVDDEGTVLRGSGASQMCWHPDFQIMDPLFEPSRMAHRREAPAEVGGWRVTSGLEDWDLLVRLATAGMVFRTSSERTVSVLETAGTRRYSVPPRFVAPLISGPDPRRLCDLMALLAEPPWVDAMRVAAAEDDAARLTPAIDAELLVRPDGPALEPIRPTTAHGLTPIVVPLSGGYTLGMPLFCSTQEHADRINELLPNYARSQLWLLRAAVDQAGMRDQVVLAGEEDGVRCGTRSNSQGLPAPAG